MAKKKPSTLINMLVALLVITAVAGAVLGLVYSVTEDTIKKGEEEKNFKAIKAVLPLENVRFDTITIIHEETAFPCNLAYDTLSNTYKGIAIKTSESGFGGKIELMVGITFDDTIRGVSVLSHSETPGLGANMGKVLVEQFTDQKPGKNFILEVTKNKEKEPEKVDAITAATITSVAFTNAVDKAYQVYEANKNRFNDTTSVEETVQTIENPDENGAEVVNETAKGGQDNE